MGNTYKEKSVGVVPIIRLGYNVMVWICLEPRG